MYTCRVCGLCGSFYCWDIIWEKYRDRFTVTKYFLFKKKIAGHYRIFIINKEAFIEIVNKNICLFRKILGSCLTSELLLKEIKINHTELLENLHNHEGLLGILLGFGRHSAMLFHKRTELSNSLTINLNNPKPIQKKIDALDVKIQPLHEYDPYIIASSNRVGFIADPKDSETIELRKKYDELYKIIRKIYSKEDWFEQTILKLTAE